MLFLVSKVRLVPIHVDFFNENLLKHVPKYVFRKIIFSYSLLSGSGRIDKREALQHFMRIGDIKFYSVVNVFYLLNSFFFNSKQKDDVHRESYPKEVTHSIVGLLYFSTMKSALSKKYMNVWLLLK